MNGPPVLAQGGQKGGPAPNWSRKDKWPGQPPGPGSASCDLQRACRWPSCCRQAADSPSPGPSIPAPCQPWVSHPRTPEGLRLGSRALPWPSPHLFPLTMSQPCLHPACLQHSPYLPWLPTGEHSGSSGACVLRQFPNRRMFGVTLAIRTTPVTPSLRRCWAPVGGQQ